MIDNRLEITKFGEWQRAFNLLDKFRGKDRLIRIVVNSTKRFARSYKTALITGLLTDGSSVGVQWEPVSPKYGDYKERVYGTSRSDLLYASSNYLVQLEKLQVTQPNQYLVKFGFFRGSLHTKSRRGGLSLAKYANIMEYGHAGRNIKARPLWDPAFRKIGGFSKLTMKIERDVNLYIRYH